MSKIRKIAFALPLVSPLYASSLATADDMVVVKKVTTLSHKISGTFAYSGRAEKSRDQVKSIVANQKTFDAARKLAKSLPTPISRAVLIRLDQARVEHLQQEGKVAEAIQYRLESAGDRDRTVLAQTIGDFLGGGPAKKELVQEAIDKIGKQVSGVD